MRLRRVTLLCSSLVLALAWAGAASAQPKTYLLGGGSGAQLQIGNGLPLPIQLTMAAPTPTAIRGWGASGTMTLPAGSGPPLGSVTTAATTGGPTMAPIVHGPGAGVFPPLLIKQRVTPIATVMGTPGGALTIPVGVLSQMNPFNVLGQNVQNSALHAVATQLNFKWPAPPTVGGVPTATTVMLGFRKSTAVLGALAKPGPGVTPVPTMTPIPAGPVALPFNPSTVFRATTGGGGKIRYINPGMTAVGYFGGVARFNVTATMIGTPAPPRSPAAPIGPAPILPSAPVTVYAVAATPPPCPGCGALLLKANPSLTMSGGPGLPGGGPQGGTPGIVLGTPGGPVPGFPVEGVVAGSTPLGTILALIGPVATFPNPGNMATSVGFPLTTGRIEITHPAALGTERFLLSGYDARTPTNGEGNIQLVGGATSLRVLSGPNANRAWVRLELSELQKTPSLSTGSLAVLSGSLLAVAMLTMVRRRNRA